MDELVQMVTGVVDVYQDYLGWTSGFVLWNVKTLDCGSKVLPYLDKNPTHPHPSLKYGHTHNEISYNTIEQLNMELGLEAHISCFISQTFWIFHRTWNISGVLPQTVRNGRHAWLAKIWQNVQTFVGESKSTIFFSRNQKMKEKSSPSAPNWISLCMYCNVWVHAVTKVSKLCK